MATELSIGLDPIWNEFSITSPVDHILICDCNNHGFARYHNEYDQSLTLEYRNEKNNNPCEPGTLTMTFIDKDGQVTKTERAVDDFIDANKEIELFMAEITMEI